MGFHKCEDECAFFLLYVIRRQDFFPLIIEQLLLALRHFFTKQYFLTYNLCNILLFFRSYIYLRQRDGEFRHHGRGHLALGH